MAKTVFLSYLPQDEIYAKSLKQILEGLEYVVVGFLDLEHGMGDSLTEAARQSLQDCGWLIVLLSNDTKDSAIIDMEISVATQPKFALRSLDTSEPSSAGLIGVILPVHDDFSKPYYDPPNVPLRLHDRVLWEYGIMKKWTEDSETIATWLEEANQRRQQFKPAATLPIEMQLKRAWRGQNAVASLNERPVLRGLIEKRTIL
jgi:hypothetical protein